MDSEVVIIARVVKASCTYSRKTKRMEKHYVLEPLGTAHELAPKESRLREKLPAKVAKKEP